MNEDALIERLVRGFSRAPLQEGGLSESDAELVSLPGSDRLLALTSDAIVEEIEMGLYVDPALIGWMTVTAAASDLAAVGADPVGLLLVESLPPALTIEMVDRLQQGIGEACREYALPVLGGDTNRSSTWHMCATAVGTVPAGEAMTRCGARPGDVLCSTGLLGAGSAFAAARLLSREPEFEFKPLARLEAGRQLRRKATACIDSSDGVLAGLDQLARLNGVGFCLSDPAPNLHPAAAEAASQHGLPAWMMLAGLHGEFELLFTMPEERVKLLEASSSGWRPLRLGSVTDDPVVHIESNGRTVRVDTSRIRDLYVGPLPPFPELIAQIHACSESET